MLLALCLAAVSPQEKVPFDALALDVTLPAFPELAAHAVEEDSADWTARLGESAVTLHLEALRIEGEPFVEPEDVTDLLEANVRPLAKDAPAFRYERTETPVGAFGHAPFASLGVGDLHDAAGAAVTRVYHLGALLEDGGWAFDVRCTPPPAAADDGAILAFLRGGFAYRGKARDGSWTDEELRTRWERDAPDAIVDELEKPIVTEHYVILGNSSGGKLFAKKMEEAYATIRKTYPFAEVKGRKKLPVFLFRTNEQYFAYYAKIADTSVEAASRSAGHSWRDYYATWYEAPNDPVHIHEATHQIFANRLHLSGGGSWFQEGVAEYIETKPGDRSAAATAVKKGRHVPLAEFVTIESLLMSSDEEAKGGDPAGDHYKQAALMIEFARESKFGKGKFEAFLKTVGRVPRSDRAAVEDALRRVWGVDLAGFERELVEYCKKR